MVQYWAERIILEAVKKEKPLKDIIFLIKGITYRPNVKELYHSRNLALVKLLISKWLKVHVYDIMYSPQEIEDMWFIYWEKADIEFDCFSLEIL